MGIWKFGEKEFLQSLHEKMGDVGLRWRDDCIEKQIAPNLSLLYSIDSISRKIDHNQSDSAKAFGQWAACTIANDVIACGAAPKGLALDIGLGAFRDEAEIFDFVDGVLDICTHYNMKYEGGNLSRGNYVCGVSWGTAAPDRVIHRDGAKNNSVLLATAPIGVGWAINLLQTAEELKGAAIPDALASIVVEYKKKPAVNLSAFQEIWNLNCIECGMDLTDGIIEFGYEIFDRTGLGVVFSPQRPHKLVQYVAALLDMEPEDIMFEPGYDTPFAHGWCIPKASIDEVKNILEKNHILYTILGEVSENVSGVYRKRDHGLVSVPRYWDDKMKNEPSYDLWKKNILI